MTRALDAVLKEIEAGNLQPCYLVGGDRVVAEPAAEALGKALGAKFGCEPVVYRRPARLLPLLDDLRTFSLFEPAKIIVAVESSVLADLSAAAALVDQAVKVLPVEPTEELVGKERDAAIRLLQAIRLFQLDPYAGSSEQILGELPDWAFKGEASVKASGKGRARTKKQIEKLRLDSIALLDAARASGIEGQAEGITEAIAEIVRNGLPEGHTLILAESSVVKEHPLLSALKKRKALISVGQLAASRKGWEGLGVLTAQLASETGVRIDSRALDELARRTLRKVAVRRGSSDAVDSDSTARFAAEYRKMAEMTEGRDIDRALVESTVDDRGEEDVWKILDDIGSGRAGSANSRLRRHLSSADDEMGTRLSFFSLLATYCRHLAAIDGELARTRLPRGERNFNRFKSSIAPKLQGNLPRGGKSPLTGLHPFRLHKAYLAVCRMPSSRVSGLLDRVLQAEMQLKGESRSPDTALELLVGDLASG